MKIQKITIKNYRSIVEETLECDDLTILVGGNGAGKSCFLQALRLFMDTSAAPNSDDFYNNDTTKPISLEVTFSDLSDEEKSEFESYLEGGTLTVQRKFPTGDYYGRGFGCLDLEPIREFSKQKGVKVKDVIPKLAELVDSGKYPGLKKVNTNISEELDRWESENKARCEYYYKSGMFQGPPNIAGGKLKNRTHFVYIPPVREAEHDASGSNNKSPLGVLIAPLLSAITEQNEDVKKVKTAVLEGFGKYRSLVESAPEKDVLEQNLTKVLQRYDAEAAATVRLSFDGELTIPTPKPKVRLLEDGFEGEVSKKGHGLQRLFIFSMLELYELYKNRTTDGSSKDNIVLVVEEPELYQHPSRIRSLARTMQVLADGNKREGVPFQIFCSTHSPYFVSLEKFPAIRKVEKIEHKAGPMQSKIASIPLKVVGDKVLKSLKQSKEVTDTSTWGRLRQILGIKGSEGFFSEGIILVEGIEDVAIILAIFNHKKVFLDDYGIAVISAEGKTNLPMLFVLYEGLHIPTYVIFDGDGDEADDKEAHRDYNEALLELIDEKREQKPKTKISSKGCVWQNSILDEIKKIYSEKKWDECYQAACDEYKMKANEGKKKYVVVLKTMECLFAKHGSHALIDDLAKLILKRFGLDK